jgi:TRAP-type transport system periplasmic protein
VLRRIGILGTSFALAASGCAGQANDRAGGTHERKPLVLTLASYPSVPWEIQPFADEVARRSGGRVRIAFRNDWRRGQRDVEPGIVRDVKAGKVDLGWVGTRAWDRFGVTSFDALHMPFLVDSYRLEEAVLESRLSARMLRSLEPLGLAGVAILPGELRKPVGVAAKLVGPDDYRGVSVGTTEARAARATMRALHAVPVPFWPGPKIPDVGAFDFPVSYFDINKYDLQAGYVTTNVDLWPRPLVVFASARTFERLTSSQRDVLRMGARAAIGPTISVIERHVEHSLAALCSRGRARLVTATATDRAQLRAAVAPVYADLDPQTSSDVAAIERIRTRIDARPEPAAPCSTRRAPTSGGIPNGTYTSTMTREDVRRAKIPPGDPLYADLPIRHTLVVDGGNYVLYATYPNGRRESTMEGTYSVYRGKMFFVSGREKLLPFSWSFDGHTLRFTDLPFHGTGYYGAFFSSPLTKTR